MQVIFLIRNGWVLSPFDPSISLDRSTTVEATKNVIAEMFKSRWEWLKLRSPLYKPWASHVLLHLQTTKTTTNKTCTSLLCFAVFESSHQIHLIIWHQRHLCQAFWWINPGSVESTAQDLKITNTPKQFKTKVWNKRRKIEDVIFDILYHLFLWANPPTKVKQHSALQHFTTLIAALKKNWFFQG